VQSARYNQALVQGDQVPFHHLEAQVSGNKVLLHPTDLPGQESLTHQVHQLLGATPEPYTRKCNTAEAFWSSLENYFFINQDTFTNELRKVSSALTYFKIGTPAGDWAQDRQKTALTATPINFGTWNDFKSAFKSQFIPEYTKLKATNAMHMSKMGQRPFDEWYLEWSTYAARSRANEDTKMFAFRKAIPQALHQKIIGVSPQPTTMKMGWWRRPRSSTMFIDSTTIQHSRAAQAAMHQGLEL
jgi:hypothetical protein